jgi:hypothetical protein
MNPLFGFISESGGSLANDGGEARQKIRNPKLVSKSAILASQLISPLLLAVGGFSRPLSAAI